MIPRSLFNFRRAGFSLIELMIVIGIIVILIGLLMPVISKARQQAMFAKCQSNLHQIGVTITAYAAENHGCIFPVGPMNMPGLTQWPQVLFETSHPPVVICPTGIDDESQSYELNMALWFCSLGSFSGSQVPASEIILAAENYLGRNNVYSDLGYYGPLNTWDPYRHGKDLRSNFLWLDMHVSNDPPYQHANQINIWGTVLPGI